MNRDVVRTVSVEDQQIERLAGVVKRQPRVADDDFYVRGTSRHGAEKAGLRADAHEFGINLVYAPGFARRAAARQRSDAKADESNAGESSALSGARGINRLLERSALVVIR